MQQPCWYDRRFKKGKLTNCVVIFPIYGRSQLRSFDTSGWLLVKSPRCFDAGWSLSVTDVHFVTVSASPGRSGWISVLSWRVLTSELWMLLKLLGNKRHLSRRVWAFTVKCPPPFCSSVCLALLGKQKLCSLMQNCAMCLDDSGFCVCVCVEGFTFSFFSEVRSCCWVFSRHSWSCNVGLSLSLPPSPSSGPGVALQPGVVVIGLCVCVTVPSDSLSCWVHSPRRPRVAAMMVVGSKPASVAKHF